MSLPDVGQASACIEAACLSEGGMGAFQTGDPGHYSIQPLEPGGMSSWLESRASGTFPESPYTLFLQENTTVVWNR